jgi:Zn-finger nucleic acid-binding protein
MSGGGVMGCLGCGRDLPAAFPGATVLCPACGRSTLVPTSARPSSAAPISSSTPYRSAAQAPQPQKTSPCPFCGNEVGALVRICPHCDVRLDNVRCARCFSLQPPGTFACGRCGQSLELEPLLDATDAPCPRCSHPLEVASTADTRIHECPRCGGLFTPKEALAEILVRAESGGALPDGAHTTRARTLEEVRYLPCPLCHATMNRVNFGRVSGVIVDICKSHGTWFDAGELTRVVAFAAGGGLDRARAREEAERKEERARSNELHLEVVALETKAEAQLRLSLWEEFLSDLFLW